MLREKLMRKIIGLLVALVVLIGAAVAAIALLYAKKYAALDIDADIL